MAEPDVKTLDAGIFVNPGLPAASWGDITHIRPLWNGEEGLWAWFCPYGEWRPGYYITKTVDLLIKAEGAVSGTARIRSAVPEAHISGWWLQKTSAQVAGGTGCRYKNCFQPKVKTYLGDQTISGFCFARTLWGVVRAELVCCATQEALNEETCPTVGEETPWTSLKGRIKNLAPVYCKDLLPYPDEPGGTASDEERAGYVSEVARVNAANRSFCGTYSGRGGAEGIVTVSALPIEGWVKPLKDVPAFREDSTQAELDEIAALTAYNMTLYGTYTPTAGDGATKTLKPFKSDTGWSSSSSSTDSSSSSESSSHSTQSRSSWSSASESTTLAYKERHKNDPPKVIDPNDSSASSNSSSSMSSPSSTSSPSSQSSDSSSSDSSSSDNSSQSDKPPFVLVKSPVLVSFYGGLQCR